MPPTASPKSAVARWQQPRLVPRPETLPMACVTGKRTDRPGRHACLDAGRREAREERACPRAGWRQPAAPGGRAPPSPPCRGPSDALPSRHVPPARPLARPDRHRPRRVELRGWEIPLPHFSCSSRVSFKIESNCALFSTLQVIRTSSRPQRSRHGPAGVAGVSTETPIL